ncbi:maestro heat-like repeat-containing protein family member 1 [Biomphalaria glabrata]|uniref:Maestro heat-like repeat-containing protein family member 1 n=2 Tax=Biomphalaria glabrata TaxID=6526 RepID=A0A9W3AUA7_BIOGL|nr:maestro heat-like repeat-containing protein family member 1 [Biomphalaria glabrata]KAI8762282.1 maestro heat-like repeat-containing protein family member 1 [Biomphalaria glabrata]
MSGINEDGTCYTGGQVDEIALALIDAAYDTDHMTREVIANSLFDLGKNKPALILSSCHSYLKKHSKLSLEHRIIILNTVEKILKERLEFVNPELAISLIKQASSELTQNKEVSPEWQTAASGVLVALGMKFCNDVMGEMLEKFQPGILPHFFVVQTIGNLAAANVYDMVPHLTAVLGTMLPMLGLAKYDNMRWVFASALSKFSEAILEYCANLDQAPDKTVSIDRFSNEIFSAYDILFNVWLQSKEAKLRLAIIEAVGHMTHIISKEKLQEQLPKILQGIFSLYKRHPEPYHITQGLCMVLDTVCVEGSLILEPYLDNLLNILFSQIFQPVDYSNPLSMKNHNELLRSYAIIARAYSGKLVGILLGKLETKDERIKIGILSIFKHVINAAVSAMEDKKEVIVSGLRGLCNETNNKVKKVFAQVIIAMAHHGYLELEGGHHMVEFIVRQCSLEDDPKGKKSPDPEHVSNQSLRSMCDNILQLVTTTIDKMESVLWPYLLELIVPEQYTSAVGPVCKSLAFLAHKKRDESAQDFWIDFETQPNIPKPSQILARLMVLVGHPKNGRDRGIHLLNLMKSISPNLDDSIVGLWDAVIPKLISYLGAGSESGDEEEEKSAEAEKWSQKNWEDLLLKMLSKSLDVVDKEEWIADLGVAIGQQIPLYANYVEERNFAFKCLGIIMRKSSKKDFVEKHLELIFNTVKHVDQIEREGCAIAVGYVASSHLDTVLARLEKVAKNDMTKKSSGILGILKDKSEVNVEQVKATLMLCYGFVALYSPPSLIISRMEATILRSISPYYPTVKETNVKQNLIRCTDLIAQALNPSHLEQEYRFTTRGEFLSHMENYIKAEPTTHLGTETRTLAMNTCANLVKLEPKLSEAEVFDLVQVCTDSLFSLSPTGLPNRKGKEESPTEILEVEAMMTAAFSAMFEIFKELINKDCTPTGLENIFKHLVPWILSQEEHERERALNTWLVVQRFYLETLKVKNPQILENEGILLGRMVPRCSDPVTSIRQLAIDNIHVTLQIALRHEGNPPEHKDQMVDALPTLKERLKKSDPNLLFSVVNDLSKVIAKKLPADCLIPFIETLQQGLLDLQSHSSSGACVVLNGIMKIRGGDIRPKVEIFLENLYEKLCQIQCPQTKTGTLRTIRTMAAHHLLPTVTSLLTYPLPYDDNVVEIWKILAQDPSLTSQTLEHFLELLLKSLPYEEKPDPRDKEKKIKTATTVPLAVTYAFTEIFKVEETRDNVLKLFPRLFAALIVRIGSSVAAKAPKEKKTEVQDVKVDKKKKGVVEKKSSKVVPIEVAISAMRTFLEHTQMTDMLEQLETTGAWALMEDEEQYPEAITLLARALITEEKETHIGDIVNSLTSVLSSLYESQRITVAAFFAELINQKCKGDEDLVQLIMNSLLGRLVDESHIVRMLCVRGLGNIASVGKEQVQTYATTILSAMMAGMDDKEDPEDFITIEAMRGLSRILGEIQEEHIRAILINVSLKIRPCLEKDKCAVRAQAFRLFGNLSRFGDGPSKAPFLEQIHSNFISLLLHLNDKEDEVRQACKFALRSLGPLMKSEVINDKFQRHLIEDGHLHYGEFMNDLSKLIIQELSEKINFYVMGCVSFFKSPWPEIKSNAAMFVGFLLGNLPKDMQTNITKEHICSALILLLKDSSPIVRAKAAEAMSLLYDY